MSLLLESPTNIEKIKDVDDRSLIKTINNIWVLDKAFKSLFKSAGFVTKDPNIYDFKNKICLPANRFSSAEGVQEPSRLGPKGLRKPWPGEVS